MVIFQPDILALISEIIWVETLPHEDRPKTILDLSIHE